MKASLHLICTRHLFTNNTRFQVVHFVLTPEAGVAEIPKVLRGEIPENSSSQIGTGNTNVKIRAIITGGATEYQDEGFKLFQDAVSPIPPVFWLRNDTTKPTPPLGPEYGKAMVARVKQALDGLSNEGRLEGKENEVVWY